MTPTLQFPQFVYIADQPLAVMAKQPEFGYLQSLPSLASGILIIFGIIGVYYVKAEEGVVFGLVAFLIAFIGVILSTGTNWTYAFVSPTLAHKLPKLSEGDPAGEDSILAIKVSFLLAQVGLLILGISMLNANIFPEWVSVTLITAITALGLLSLFSECQFMRALYNVLIGVGPIMIGYSLYRQADAK